ncbi:Putative alpha-ketoglutarate-dependent dioxygenase ABH7, partial [Chelonia mydas]
LSQKLELQLGRHGYQFDHWDGFCVCRVAGLSWLSSGVTQLVSDQNPEDRMDLLLPGRWLYILRGPACYEFTHEILKDKESFFNGQKIP